MPAHLLHEEVGGGLPAGPGVRVLCLPLAPSSFISAAPAALRCCCCLGGKWSGHRRVSVHAHPPAHTDVCVRVCVCVASLRRFSVMRRSHSVQT